MVIAMKCRCGRPIPAGGHWLMHACACGLVTDIVEAQALQAVGREPEEDLPSSPFFHRLIEAIMGKQATTKGGAT